MVSHWLSVFELFLENWMHPADSQMKDWAREIVLQEFAHLLSNRKVLGQCNWKQTWLVSSEIHYKPKVLSYKLFPFFCYLSHLLACHLSCDRHKDGNESEVPAFDCFTEWKAFQVLEMKEASMRIKGVIKKINGASVFILKVII